MRRRSGRAAGYVLVALMAGVVGAIAVRLMDRAAPAGVLGGGGPVRTYTEVVEKAEPAATNESVVKVVKSVGPAVISIDTLARASSGIGFPSDEVKEGQGSGFIINGREGLAVTNNHVVEGAQQIRVHLQDKRTLDATVVGTDPVGDVALIRIKGGGDLPEIKFGDSDKLAIGQLTIAIGNPLGFENTVTVGVLSQVGRRLEGKIRRIPLDDLLQTDAAINPGNSGGPLLDGYGRVIGMNTAIITTAPGLGFAVAANPIKKSVNDILTKGHVVRPWVGVTMAELTQDVAQELGIPVGDRKGVAIAEARKGEPADQAGIQRGDVITEAQGRPVSSGDELRKLIRKMEPGLKLVLKGRRGDAPKTWTVTIGEMPGADQLQE